jgi:hypothetical protein
MSLHWGSERCDPPLPDGEEEGAWRQTLIFGSCAISLPRLTSETLPEWLWRIRYFQQVCDGTAFQLHYGVTEPGKKRDEDISVPILKRWVGLWTNASECKKRKEWMAAMDTVASRRDLPKHNAETQAAVDKLVADELAAAGWEMVKPARKRSKKP